MTVKMEFSYKPNYKRMLYATFFFLACATFFLELASSNTKGLSISNVIHLDPRQATIFWWVLGGLSAGLTGLGCFGFVKALFFDGVIVLSGETVSIPTGFFGRGNTTVRYADIRRVSVKKIKSTKWLELEAEKRAHVSADWFMDAQAFQKMYDTLLDRVSSARGKLSS